MISILKTLEHLGYVIECAAVDYMGEVKTELSSLCEKLECDSEYSFERSEKIARDLRQALENYRRRENMAGSSGLSRVNRELWRMVFTSKNSQQG